jgi:glutathione peroxidase
MTSIYDFEVRRITGEAAPMSAYEGKVLLVVNTASACGFTPQYEGLEELYRKHKDRGFEVLGFPCNQFGHQEPGDEATIASFCKTHFDVSFPMHQKVDVNGDAAHPLFVHLKEEAPGLLGSKSVKWNFTKFLVDRTGKVVKRFAPQTKPAELEAEVAALL